MATTKKNTSTALPGVMKGSTVGTGKVTTSTALPGVMKGSTVGTGKITAPKTGGGIVTGGTGGGKTGGKKTDTFTDTPTDTTLDTGADKATEDLLLKLQQQKDASERKDAFELLKDIFSQYGLEELSATIEGYMKGDVGPNEAALLLKQTPAYKKRFAGNETRKASGLNVISEAEYLALENSYSETLKAYGQAGYFGTDRVTRQAKLAEAIGADISAVEFKERISTVVDRVNSADPAVKSTLRSFYKITDEDLVGYFLNPKENLPRLKEKVTAAEIGSAASGQGLSTSMASAEELAKFGVDLATARQGYATVGEVLPTGERLSAIYKEEGINYTQQTAEEEVFKGLASAKRKRQALAEKEIGTFSGSSGTSKASMTSQTSGLI
jgi:hypothetical protein